MTDGYDRWIARKIGIPGRIPTAAALAGHQLDRLNRLVDFLRAHSPFYRRHLEGCGRTPLASLADLREFPFTTVEDVNASGLKMVCVNQGEISHVVTLATSGTTGPPKQLYFTADDQELSVEIFRQSMAQLIGKGDVAHVLLPAARPGSVGDLLARAIAGLGAEPVRYGLVEHLPAALDSLAARSAAALVGLPAQVLALAKYHRAANGGRTPGLRNVLLCTDHVSGAVKEEIAAAWGCRVLGYYGMTEAGFGGGMECRAGDGYHLHEADLYYEIVDPASGRPVPEGREGEVVFSTLTRRGMPLLRYRTGDLSRFITGACPCGSALRRMAAIRTRRSGLVSLGGGRPLTMADLDEALFPLPGVVDFSATLRGAEAGRRLEIGVDSLGADTTEDMARRALARVPAIRSALASETLDLAVVLTPVVDRIAGGAGKRRIHLPEPPSSDGG